MGTKKKRAKTPRVVLLDTRTLASLDGLVNQLTEAINRMGDLATLVQQLGEGARQLLPLVSEMHAKQQLRSSAATRANETRRAAAESGQLQDAKTVQDYDGPGF